MESISIEVMEKHRYINVEHNDWYEGVYESFKERMEKQGITVDVMYFSGFCSQGDGACFDGCINPLRFMRKHFPTEYPMLRKVVALGGRVHLTSKHTGRYYHEHSTRFELDVDGLEYLIEQPTDFHEQVVESMDRQLQDELNTFEERSAEILRGYMGQLYRELETEHDYFTSDEVVAETIIANELHKECA